ncbi:MAG: hypothetical protein HOP16_02735 [Acidobacteria bacterium]|nr:hypothetical protein [Acidobacteriota bacterium]
MRDSDGWSMLMTFTKTALFTFLVAAFAHPAFAQVDLTGSYQTRMYEDYIERGPGEFMGNYTGMPLTDEGRAKALLYTSNLPSIYERQCLPQSAGVFQYRPTGFRIWSENGPEGDVVAWVIGGDNLRNDIRIWMDGRPALSPNALHTAGGFATGKWEGDTLTARVTHLKTAWIRRGVGIPGSDDTTITIHLTRRGDLLTVMTIQEDPHYLTEPHVVSRVWQWNPRGTEIARPQCNTANEIPSLEDTGGVPHYLPGENPEEDYMVRTFNIPKEAAMGHAETLYPEYRKKLKGVYTPPASCDARRPGYCCGWIETQGRPGGAPNLTCNDGGFGVLGPRGRRPEATAK